MRHWNNGTDHRHSKSCCDKSSPARRTIIEQKITNIHFAVDTWWRHQMETYSALLAICVGNSPVPSEFRPQRPVTRSFDVFFDLHSNKRLSKQWWGWWFETPSCPWWRHCNDFQQLGYHLRFNFVAMRSEYDYAFPFISISLRFKIFMAPFSTLGDFPKLGFLGL